MALLALDQLAQDAEDCRYWALGLREEIKGGGNIENCVKLAHDLSSRAGKLNRVFCALQHAAQGKEDE